MTITRLAKASTFGEAVIFSKNKKYPATVVASELTSVLLISRTQLLKLFTLDTDTMALFMETLSERLVLLNQKIELLSRTTLRKGLLTF